MSEIRVVEKPWGREEILDLNEFYCFKRITVFDGAGTSLQFHNEKVETTYVHSGNALFSYQDENGNVVKKMVGAGFVAKLPNKVVHRFEAVGGDVVLYECSTIHINDVVRLEDSYGRAGTSHP